MTLQQFLIETFLALFNLVAILASFVWAQLVILAPLVIGIVLNLLDQAARSLGFTLPEVAAIAIVGTFAYGVLFGKGGGSHGGGHKPAAKKADHGHGGGHKPAAAKPAAKKKDDHHGGGHGAHH